MITTDQPADTIRPASIPAGPAPARPAGRQPGTGADTDAGTGDVLLPVRSRTGTVVRKDREIVATTDEVLDRVDTENDAHVRPDDDYRRHGVEDPFDADRVERQPQADIVGELVPDPDADRLLQLVHLDGAALEALTTGEWTLVLPRRRRRRRVSAMPTLQTGATPPVFAIWLGNVPPVYPFPTTSAALHGSAVKLIGTGGQQHFHVVTDRQVWVRALNASGSTSWVDVWEEAL